VPPLEVRRQLWAEAEEIGSRWTNLQTHDRMVIDGVEVFVRHPALPDWERQDVRNDDSIVLELSWRDVSIVLTGDIGRDVEEAIGPLFAPARFRVLKVPHHGSLTSSSATFLQALQPTIAVVSAGRGNIFGHPVPVVLDRYREIHADIFRTDRDGAITLETDGYSIEIETFTGERRLFP
jgi:competence protein ComEC